MKQMPAGAFKAQCLTVMKQVQATGEPVVVTKRGVALVKVVPAEAENNDIFGFMVGRVKIVGDIESPIPVKWEVTKRCFCSIPMYWFGFRRNRQNCRNRPAGLSAGPPGLAASPFPRLRCGNWPALPVMVALRSREPSKPTSKKSLQEWRFVRSQQRLLYSPTSFRQTTRATRSTASLVPR